MKPSLKSIILMAILFNIMIAQTPERKNMAVYNFTGLGVSNIEAQVISDRIRVELTRLETFSIIERGLMEQILKEQVLQLSGLCDDASCLVEVGKILAVHYIVGGSVSKIGNLFTIEARIIDVESGEIVNSIVEDYNGPIENLLVQTTKIVAAKLSGVETDKSSVVLTGTCDLLIQSNPPGGTIYINDKPMGDVTPFWIEGLLEGDYSIKVRKGNLIGLTTTSLKRNDRIELTVKLAKEQFMLRINSEPEGADVYINQANIGKTPIDHTVTDTTIAYRIKLHKDLYFDLEEKVHFSENDMLRLNYYLEPCGKLLIPYSKDIKVYLNDRNIDELPNVVEEFTRFSFQGWTIDQLDLREYNLRIEKQFHSPYLQKVGLTTKNPSQTIEYKMQLLNANVAIFSAVECSGSLSGSQISEFQLVPGQYTKLNVPFGNYTLSAYSPGYLPVTRDVAIFNKNPDPFAINIQLPDKDLALKRSLMFPGLGQIYSRQPEKGIMLGAITSSGVAWLISSVMKYNNELDIYNDLADKYSSAMTINDMDYYRTKLETSQNLLISYRNQFFFASSMTLISYSWNIYDITKRYPNE